MKTTYLRNYLVCLLLAVLWPSEIWSVPVATDSIAQVSGESTYILVDKPALTLHVISGTDTLFSAPVCAGSNYGNKQRRGDRRTPEGAFHISMIQDSRNWSHNFHDGNGPTPHAYGPWFFRLKTEPWRAIGIHGTCFPESIGKRESEGCIRLNNEDLTQLRGFVRIGMEVIITPDVSTTDSPEENGG